MVKENNCPEDGCVTVRLLSQDLKKDLEFVSTRLSGAVAQSMECLQRFNEAHDDLKTSIVKMRSSLDEQNIRLEQGAKMFNELRAESEVHRREIGANRLKIAVLDDHDQHRGHPLSAKKVTTIGSIGGGIAGTIIYVIAEVIKVLKG